MFMNNNKDIGKILKEQLDEIIDKNLYDDLNYGKKLLQRCSNYYQYATYDIMRYNYCQYRDEVLRYINNIQNRYANLIALYNNVNGSSNGNYNTECLDIKAYVDFLEKISNAKKNTDNFEKMLEVFIKR
mgnify:FL=1